ncbi:MAG: tetratricopeptide repeat protein, partial [Ignavibacteriaceae bacterium]
MSNVSSTTVLRIVFFLSVYSIIGISSLKIEDKKQTLIQTSFTFDIDSLISEIKLNGWNEISFDKYSFYLLNTQTDLIYEIDRVNSLPGSFERSCLQALILKKELRFNEMFDSLYVLLPQKSGYFNFYENLVFAANATGRLSLLESEINPLLSGLIQAAKGEYENAKDEYFKALEKDQSDYNIFYQISYMYRNTGDYDKSLNVLNDAVSMAKGDERFLIKAAIAEGSLNYLSGNYLRAEKLYEKALAASKKIYDRQNEIVSVVNLGILHDLEGDVEKARKYFNDGLTLAQKIKDIDLEAFAYSELGVSYTFTNDIINAKENYLKSFLIYKKINDRLRLSLLSENIGKIYTYLFDYKSAIKYYEQGAEYAGENKRARAVNIMGMADVYSNLSNYS